MRAPLHQARNRTEARGALTVNRDEISTSLVDQVLIQTRQRILTGEYPPGSRLRLHDLARESGVSLIPVREALRILESERLVHTVPNKGATVAELSMEDLKDLYAVRMQLESDAVASSPPLSAEEAQAFEGLLTELARANDRKDLTRAMQLHRAFHFGLYERSQSDWRIHLIEVLWNHAERYQWLSLAERHDAAFAEHHRILEELQKGDRKRAGTALRQHLATTRRLLEAAYANHARLLAVGGSTG